MNYIELFEEAIFTLNDGLHIVERVHQDIYRLSKKGSSIASIGLVALTHGDEIVGLHILTELALRICAGKITVKGDIYFILANRHAYLKRQRYIDKDLNRLYGQQSLGSTVEEKRVVQIKEVLKHCDYVIDFHQTIGETFHPFFILPFNQGGYGWAASIASGIPIILRDTSKVVTTLSSYVESLGKKGVTFEVGANGVDDVQINRGVEIASNIIDFAAGVLPKLEYKKKKTPVYTMNYFQEYSTGEVKCFKLKTLLGILTINIG